jgi:preprotein translocase subunit SecD
MAHQPLNKPMNSYPGWKYFLLVFVLFIAVIYALPNMYGKDYAVQISGIKGNLVTQETIDSVKSKLDQNKIEYFDGALKNGHYIIRFKDPETQIKAKEAIADLKDIRDRRYIAALNLVPATPDWLNGLNANPMSLGLDLSGGIEFLMEVNMDEVIEKRLEQYNKDIKATLREDKLRYTSVKTDKNGSVSISFRDEEMRDKAFTLVRANMPELDLQRREEGELFLVKGSVSLAKIKEIKDYAISQNMSILRARVNELGVAEPLVQRVGERIVVQLPGIQDSTEAKRLLGKVATVQLRMQNENVRPGGRIPANSEEIMHRDGRPIVLKKELILDGQHILDASVGYDENGMPQVNLRLDSEGATKIKVASTKNIKKMMATVFVEYRDDPVKKNKDGRPLQVKHVEVINIARINSVLPASFRITGLEAQEAQYLAKDIRAGALVAPIQIISESTIGPSLGKENVEAGMLSVQLGFIIVLVFMLAYYKLFGLFANIALASNLVLIVSVLSLFGATLTLPGIAGIVLTVGMAVDANVLIFERIREELRDGSKPQQAINEGYAKALSTIADANVTTIIAAAILFALGTGAIKGFAVTLFIGILTSMFTAIMGTRALANLWYGSKNVKTLSI